MPSSRWPRTPRLASLYLVTPTRSSAPRPLRETLVASVRLASRRCVAVGRPPLPHTRTHIVAVVPHPSRPCCHRRRLSEPDNLLPSPSHSSGRFARRFPPRGSFPLHCCHCWAFSVLYSSWSVFAPLPPSRAQKSFRTPPKLISLQCQAGAPSAPAIAPSPLYSDTV